MATTPDCLFCKIAAGTIPVTRIYENDAVLVFPDINPQAPVHLLIIPKRHFASVVSTSAAEADIHSALLLAANTVAQRQHLDNGFRLVFNTGSDGGQTVEHLHMHLLAGRQMHWPPG